MWSAQTDVGGQAVILASVSWEPDLCRAPFKQYQMVLVCTSARGSFSWAGCEESPR